MNISCAKGAIFLDHTEFHSSPKTLCEVRSSDFGKGNRWVWWDRRFCLVLLVLPRPEMRVPFSWQRPPQSPGSKQISALRPEMRQFSMVLRSRSPGHAQRSLHDTRTARIRVRILQRNTRAIDRRGAVSRDVEYVE